MCLYKIDYSVYISMYDNERVYVLVNVCIKRGEEKRERCKKKHLVTLRDEECVCLSIRVCCVCLFKRERDRDRDREREREREIKRSI